MAKRKYSKKNKLSIEVVVIVLVLAFILAAAAAIMHFAGVLDDVLGMLNIDLPFLETPDDGDTPPREPVSVEGEMEIHVIDCGQADSILLLSEDEVMLVDTGDLKDSYTNKIINYLKSFNITKIDYLILTHADSDHIGGAPEIINEFDVEKCIMPDFVKTTKIYENTLLALAENEVDCSVPVPGEVFKIGEASCKVLAPLDDYEDCNDTSVVIRVDFGARSVLLTGDAEKESEADIVATYTKADLKVDVLKSGHHGSRTSSSEALLDLCDPEYAVISCGDGNSYGHPHPETLDKYDDYGIEYYRTDLHGTVIIKTDGETLTITTEKTA